MSACRRSSNRQQPRSRKKSPRPTPKPSALWNCCARKAKQKRWPQSRRGLQFKPSGPDFSGPFFCKNFNHKGHEGARRLKETVWPCHIEFLQIGICRRNLLLAYGFMVSRESRFLPFASSGFGMTNFREKHIGTAEAMPFQVVPP